MSSFTSQNITSRINKRNPSLHWLRLFISIIIGIILMMSYLVWNVGNMPIKVAKYTIEKWYTITVLNDKLEFTLLPLGDIDFGLVFLLQKILLLLQEHMSTRKQERLFTIF